MNHVNDNDDDDDDWVTTNPFSNKKWFDVCNITRHKSESVSEDDKIHKVCFALKIFKEDRQQ